MRLKVLVVNHAVELGGAELLLVRTIDNLDLSRFELEAACPHPGPLTEELGKRSVRVHLGHPRERLLRIRRKSLGRERLSFLWYPIDFAVSVIRLLLLVRKGSFDLVLTNSAKADIYGSLAGRLAGKPVVWRIHDIVSEDAFSRLNIFLFRLFATLFASKVLAISNAVADALVSHGIPRKKVKTVYNGVDTGVLVTAEERSRIRRELGIGEEQMAVALVGRLVDWKGPDVFIKAAREVADKVSDAVFLLIGSAVYGEESYVRQLESLVENLGISSRVLFTGFRRDITKVMGSIDCLVHASTLPEPFGLVIAEAMACGTPVVATRAGGVPEIVQDGVTGILVPPGDPKALASAVIEILTDQERAAAMGQKAKERVHELFDIRKSAEHIQAELISVVEAARRAGQRTAVGP